jgi:hypothetical protein
MARDKELNPTKADLEKLAKPSRQDNPGRQAEADRQAAEAKEELKER